MWWVRSCEASSTMRISQSYSSKIDRGIRSRTNFSVSSAWYAMTKMSSRGLESNSAVLSSGGYHISRVALYALYAAGMVVVVAGILLRLDGLTSSLWLDEFGTFWVVEGNFATMLERAWVFQGQSPLYYAFPWMSRQVFGDSELALRLPSLLFGCLSVIAVYSSARAIGGSTAGLSAGCPCRRHSTQWTRARTHS